MAEIPDSLGDRIGAVDVTETSHVEGRAIQMGENRLDESGDWMRSKIRGNIANFQSPIRRPIARLRAWRSDGREPFGPAAMFVPQGFGGKPWMIVQRQ